MGGWFWVADSAHGQRQGRDERAASEASPCTTWIESTGCRRRRRLRRRRRVRRESAADRVSPVCATGEESSTRQAAARARASRNPR